MQSLKDKYKELSSDFGTLPVAQKKERITQLYDYYLKNFPADEVVSKAKKSEIFSKCENGSNLTSWYELLQRRIDAIPKVPSEL